MSCTFPERKPDSTEIALCGEPATVRAPDGRERCYDHAKMCPCGNPSVDGTCAGHPADWKPVEL